MIYQRTNYENNIYISAVITSAINFNNLKNTNKPEKKIIAFKLAFKKRYCNTKNTKY